MKYFTVIFLLSCIAVAKGTKPTASHKADAETSSGSTSAGSFTQPTAHIGCLFQGEKDIKFYLYSHDLNNSHKLKFNSTINSEWVNREWKTIVYIHGWRGGTGLQQVMKNAYLEQSDQKVNLIEVDWLKGAYNPLYCPSADRVPDVGETVAKFIGLNQGKFNLETLIVVGHSLGAHAAGFAGKFLQSKLKFKPRIIVGLDPAGPAFCGKTPKLQPDDANDVVIIHTSSVFGHLEPLGTLDVYISGGRRQPRCSNIQSHSFAKLIYKEMVIGVKPLIGHRYSSFADVTNDIIPTGDAIQLFHGVPFPPRGTLVYVNTREQEHLIPEFDEYFDSKSNECCGVM